MIGFFESCSSVKIVSETSLFLFSNLLKSFKSGGYLIPHQLHFWINLLTFLLFLVFFHNSLWWIAIKIAYWKNLLWPLLLLLGFIVVFLLNNHSGVCISHGPPSELILTNLTYVKDHYLPDYFQYDLHDFY